MHLEFTILSDVQVENALLALENVPNTAAAAKRLCVDTLPELLMHSCGPRRRKNGGYRII